MTYGHLATPLKFIATYAKMARYILIGGTIRRSSRPVILQRCNYIAIIKFRNIHINIHDGDTINKLHAFIVNSLMLLNLCLASCI